MKLSSIALGALVTLSINVFAQSDVKEQPLVKKPKTEKPKPKKCVKPVLVDTITTSNPKQKSPRYCPTCGRG